MRIFPILILAMAIATPAAAQLRPLVEPPASAAAAQSGGVEVFLLNDGADDLPLSPPATLEAVARDGTPLRLIAVTDSAGIVRAGGFARVRYRLAASDNALAGAAPAPAVAARAAPAETVTIASRGESRAVLDRLRPYEPVYGAFGAGTAGGKLQLSFAARVLGRDDGPRLSFAYTQTMLWALDRPSGPIGPTTYSPEVFVDMPIGDTLLLGGGYAHDSNGGGPGRSIDVNRLFVRATKSFDLGKGWRVDLTPQVWAYVEQRGVAPDLDRYWGYTSLRASIGQTDGLKVSGTLRGNPGTGKAAGELFASYPLATIGLTGIYLFGQGFVGYGETLSTYARHDSHARLGIAFTR
jgi:phospholipase A1